MERKILNVQGMMCDACVGHVTKALAGLDGVQAAKVDLAAAQAVVTYDPAKVGVRQMQDAIEDEGYEASA
jgi:copper ion binding protein